LIAGKHTEKERKLGSYKGQTAFPLGLCPSAHLLKDVCNFSKEEFASAVELSKDIWIFLSESGFVTKTFDQVFQFVCSCNGVNDAWNKANLAVAVKKSVLARGYRMTEGEALNITTKFKHPIRFVNEVLDLCKNEQMTPAQAEKNLLWNIVAQDPLSWMDEMRKRSFGAPIHET